MSQKKMTAPASLDSSKQAQLSVVRGPRARMRKHLLDTAMTMMAEGVTPSISELAEQAQVSRATAYRYFPTQSDLVAAVVGESLGPILSWRPSSDDAAERIDQLLVYAYPRLEQYEVQLRAAIQISLRQSAEERASKHKNPRPLVRGNRIEFLKMAVEPLKEEVDDKTFERTVQALSMLYGTEVFLVLKDIWHLELAQIIDIVRWTSRGIIEHARKTGKHAAKPSRSK
jgi:AcrR family transcriptional regulator